MSLWLVAGLIAPVWADRTLVRIKTNFGDIVLSLLTDDAPKTVANFLDYVESDFYDGLIFHRVVNDPNPFVIQAGAYDPNLYQANSGNDPNFFLNPNWTKDPNFFHPPNPPVESEADNGFSNVRGTVAMALSGGDANSGTSQFFISLADNSFLDAQNFTVFGEVLAGMEPNGVVDTIGSVMTMSIGAGAFILKDVPDANTQVIIQDVTVERVFGSDSSMFNNVAFLRAADGELRTYVGQGNFSGKRYTHAFSEEKFLGVQSLRWKQTAVSIFGVPAFELALAKDEDGVIWALDYQIDGEPMVEANSIFEAVTLSQLGQEDMLFKLISGDVNKNDPNDPNNRITMSDGGLTMTEQIVGFTESLGVFPDFDNELVQVRSVIEPNPGMADWRWNHESLGLVLELVDNAAQQGAIDPNGDGWRFLIPDTIAGLEVSLKAGKSRTIPSDSFRLTGRFDLDRESVANNTLFVFMGPFEATIEAGNFKHSKSNMKFTYKGVLSGGGKLFMQIDFSTLTFVLRAGKVNLTGLDKPVRVEIAVGNLFSAGQALLRQGDLFPVAFRQGVSNSLRVDGFRYVSDNQSGFSTSRSLKIKGALATRVDPNDLTGQEITVKWGTTTMTIPAKDPNQPNTPFLVRKGVGQKYVYRSNSGSLSQPIRQAVFDLDRSRFKIGIRSSGLASPTGAGQDFSIQFDLTNEVRFDETVTGVAVGNLPKLSGE